LSDYEGFSKQDLIDRKEALYQEWADNYSRNEELNKEIMEISRILMKRKLLEEK